MKNPSSKKARLNIDCTANERKFIRLLAAKEDKSISQYILDLARCEMKKAGLLESYETFLNCISGSAATKNEPEISAQ